MGISLILLLLGIVLSMLSSWYVHMQFAKYKMARNKSEISGCEAAMMILEQNGIEGVTVERVKGNLNDRYNPKNRTLYLSDTVYNVRSIGSVAVAAHECGHALQHAFGYQPLKFRTLLFPYANIGSRYGILIVAIGLLLEKYYGVFGVKGLPITQIGILVFSVAVLFQFVTLPVEFDASNRALDMLRTSGILEEDEMHGAISILRAAAFTYVASAATALMELLRIIIRTSGSRR